MTLPLLSMGRFLAAATLALNFSQAAPAASLPPANSGYQKIIRPFLEKHCTDCHDKDEAKGELRLDSLANDFRDPKTVEAWTHVHDRLRDGEMPPQKKTNPTLLQAGPSKNGWQSRLKRTRHGPQSFAA